MGQSLLKTGESTKNLDNFITIRGHSKSKFVEKGGGGGPWKEKKTERGGGGGGGGGSLKSKQNRRGGRGS